MRQHIAASAFLHKDLAERDPMTLFVRLYVCVRTMWLWFYGMVVRRWYSDAAVIRKYSASGRVFGYAVSFVSPMGECVGFEELLNEWDFWERHLLLRGYRSLPIDDFVQYGGYGIALPPIEKSSPESPCLSHAEIYRQMFLGKIGPAMDFGQMEEGQVYTGTFIEPSTRAFCDR